MKKTIYWHHGLLLQPQHFQYQDQLMQSALDRVWRTLAGDHWGVVSLALDDNLFADNIVQLSQGCLVFPDGAWADLGNNAQIDALSLTAEHFGSESELIVYAALPRYAEHESALGKRFVDEADHVTIADSFTGGDPVDMPVLDFQLRLALKHRTQSPMPASEPVYLQPNEQAIAIARVIWRNEKLELDESFIPPSLTVQGVPALRGLCSSLLKDLLDRCRQLEEYKGGLETSEFSSRVFRYRLALQTLSRYTALLDHLSNSPKATADDVYVCLKQLLAEVSVFSDKLDVLGQQGPDSGALSYQHSKADRSFQLLREKLSMTLNELSVRPEQLVRMEANADGNLQATLPKDFARNLHRVYLIVRTGNPANQWLDDFLSFAKLAPAALLQTILDKAIPGIELMAEAGRPEGLPHRPNSWYFSFNLDEASELLNAVKQGDDLVLYWRNQPDDVAIELVQVKG